MLGVMCGMVVRSISKPSRWRPVMIRRSSSAPPWVAQKKQCSIQAGKKRSGSEELLFLDTLGISCLPLPFGGESLDPTRDGEPVEPLRVEPRPP